MVVARIDHDGLTADILILQRRPAVELGGHFTVVTGNNQLIAFF